MPHHRMEGGGTVPWSKARSLDERKRAQLALGGKGAQRVGNWWTQVKAPWSCCCLSAQESSRFCRSAVWATFSWEIWRIRGWECECNKALWRNHGELQTNWKWIEIKWWNAKALNNWLGKVYGRYLPWELAQSWIALRPTSANERSNRLSIRETRHSNRRNDWQRFTD